MRGGREREGRRERGEVKGRERGRKREREGRGGEREERRKGERGGRERAGKRRVKEIRVHAHTCITVLYETFVLMLIKTVNTCIYIYVYVHITRISRL